MSRIRRRLADWLKPAPMASRKTHTAYSEQIMHADEDAYTGRVYDYATGALLEEFEGRGGRKAAGQAAAKRLRKYRKG